jgi:hypothetical protein
MKSLSFAEFFAMPPGTIFGQATGLPHQFSTGLYRKGDSWDAVGENDDEDSEEAAIEVIDLLLDDDGHASAEWWHAYPGGLEDDHRFLVYDSDDLDRLAELIERRTP